MSLDRSSVIVPWLQKRSVISYSSLGHHSALTSSGKLLKWGGYSGGVLGLGDPGELPVGSPGGYMTKEDQAKRKARSLESKLPPNVKVPSEVRFDHGLVVKGRVERYCFAAGASSGHSIALVFDLADDEVVAPHNSNDNKGSCHLM